MAATLAVMAAGCSSPSRSSADPTPQPPPFPIGQIGTAVHVKESSGATADITLNSAAWFPPGCSGGWECNVIELTITGTSATPFKYKDIYVVAGFDGGDEAFTHPNEGHWWGGDYMVDFAKINKMPPLRTGSVTNGQTAHGYIGYGCNMCEGNLYIKFQDPDTENPNSPTPITTVAGWKTHT